MRCVIVTADNDVLISLTQLFASLKKLAVEIELVLNALRASAAIGEVDVEEDKVFELHFNNPPFAIVKRIIETDNNANGGNACPDANAGVSLLLSREEIALVIFEVLHVFAELVGLRLDFLDAEYVRHLFGKPFWKTFLPGSSQAVNIPAEDS